MNFSGLETRNILKNRSDIFTLIIFSLGAFLIILKQNIVRDAINMSLKICISAIIPSIFPFMILSDFLISNFYIDGNSRPARLFSKIFHINAIGLLPFLIGNICGFPLGAQIATRLYEEGGISRDEYDRLVPLCSNPSIAFVISGVGAGMRGSVMEGLILFIAVFAATVISGIIWRGRFSASDFHQNFTDSHFSLASSIKGAALSIIYVSAYIIFFSVLISFLKLMRLPTLLHVVLASFLEIGNAASLIASSDIEMASMPLTAFSLAFSGLSVYMQVLCFSIGEKRNKYYIKMKLTEGGIAFIVALLLSILII